MPPAGARTIPISIAAEPDPTWAICPDVSRARISSGVAGNPTSSLKTAIDSKGLRPMIFQRLWSDTVLP